MSDNEMQSEEVDQATAESMIDGVVFGEEVRGAEQGTNPHSTRSMVIVANVSVVQDGGRGELGISVWDKNSNPLGAAGASAHYYTGGDVHVQYNSATAIIPPGGRYLLNTYETFPKVEFRRWKYYV